MIHPVVILISAIIMTIALFIGTYQYVKASAAAQVIRARVEKSSE